MFLIVDFLNVAYRGFYAIRNLSNSKGEPTNAVYGFIQMMRKWVVDVKPTHLVIVYDGEPKRRLDLLPEYKSTRAPTPDLLIPQLAKLKEVIPFFGWPTILHDEEEADDLAAAIACAAAKSNFDVRIGSNDKDFLQILSPKIKVLRSTPKETILADEEWLKNRWGITPDQTVDFFALQGDHVDNIPGVPGVGEKTASELIQRFGSIDKILASVDQIKRPKLKASLSESGNVLKRNKELIAVNPISKLPPLEEFRLQRPQYESLLAALSELEFKTLLKVYTDESARSSESRQTMLF
jgi:DNA polymerase I